MSKTTATATATVTRLSDRALADNVDRLGDLNAEISRLKERTDEIKNKLIAAGAGEIEGKRYRAVISSRETVRLDPKVVRGFLTATEILAATKTTSSVSVTLYDL